MQNMTGKVEPCPTYNAPVSNCSVNPGKPSKAGRRGVKKKKQKVTDVITFDKIIRELFGNASLKTTPKGVKIEEGMH